MKNDYPWGLSPEVADVLKDIPPADFHPLAYFDKHLDCIRVMIKDCSFTEIRLDKIFTIYEANHTSSLEYVGFSIKGVRYFVEQLGISTTGPVFITEILDQIVKENPEACVDLIQKRFSSLLVQQVTVEDFEYAKAA